MRRYLQPEELELTDEERRAARTASSAQPLGQGIGSAVGSIAGGALGALGLLVPGLGAVTLPAGLAAGGALGSAIGGSIGGGIAEDAEDTVMRGQEQRTKKTTAEERRMRAIQAYLNREAP